MDLNLDYRTVWIFNERDVERTGSGVRVRGHENLEVLADAKPFSSTDTKCSFAIWKSTLSTSVPLTAHTANKLPEASTTIRADFVCEDCLGVPTYAASTSVKGNLTERPSKPGAVISKGFSNCAIATVMRLRVDA